MNPYGLPGIHSFADMLAFHQQQQRALRNHALFFGSQPNSPYATSLLGQPPQLNPYAMANNQPSTSESTSRNYQRREYGSDGSRPARDPPYWKTGIVPKGNGPSTSTGQQNGNTPSRGTKRHWDDASRRQDYYGDEEAFFVVDDGPQTRAYSVDKDLSIKCYSKKIAEFARNSNRSEWVICEEDRRFARDPYMAKLRAWDSPECFNCTRRGHRAAECPEPKVREACRICDADEHSTRRCTELICALCPDGHHVRERCPMHGLKCQDCGELDHSSACCPERWRRFHATTNGDPQRSSSQQDNGSAGPSKNNSGDEVILVEEVVVVGEQRGKPLRDEPEITVRSNRPEEKADRGNEIVFVEEVVVVVQKKDTRSDEIGSRLNGGGDGDDVVILKEGAHDK